MTKNKFKKLLILFGGVLAGTSLVSCGNDVITNNTSSETETSGASTQTSQTSSEESKLEELTKKYNCISLSSAIEKATAAGSEGTEESYYICGTISTISKPQYGEMTITDGTNSLYVFGTMDKDSVGYANMTSKPLAGDIVVLYGKLKTYNDSPEMGKSVITEFYHEEAKADDSYITKSISEVRESETGSKVSVTGIVAQITYANGMIPNGFYLMDDESSIYVYGEAAQAVKVGNRVTVEGVRDQFIASSEETNAKKYGYTGSIQISSPKIITNDNNTNELPLSNVESITIKDLMEHPLTDNITNIIYKTNCLVKKAQGDGFLNYYLDDIDGKTGSYVYTQCSGADLDYLEPYDGKICEVYFTAINCKSSASGCVYRFIPILVNDNNYTYDESNACSDALTYYGLTQFKETTFEADPSLELLAEASFELLNVSGISFTYASSDENVVYVENNILHTKSNGEATLTITASYKTYSESKTISFNVTKPNEIESITVKEAIESASQTEITVKGIVGPSVVNQTGGFYLMDSTGIIAVKVSADEMKTLTIGDEIIIKGTREMYSKKEKSIGQSVIVDATIESNLHGSNSLPLDTLITDKTLADLVGFAVSEDHTAEMYQVTCKVSKKETAYSTTYSLTSGTTTLQLYSANGNQYSFLNDYVDTEITIIVTLCNWNDKTSYKGCLLAIVTSDGYVYNLVNFNK